MKMNEEKHGVDRGATPSVKITQGEERYLKRSLIILFTLIAIINAVVCRLTMGAQLHAGSSTLVRIDQLSSRIQSGQWPAATPCGMNWPAPEKMAYFESPVPFVESVYAVGWNKDRAKYEMEVIRVGVPFNTIEIKKTQVSLHGVISHSNPPAGNEPGMRWVGWGLLINPMIYAVVIWLSIGLVPVAFVAYGRYSQYRNWANKALCSRCGYDIQELPICPECGLESCCETVSAEPR